MDENKNPSTNSPLTTNPVAVQPEPLTPVVDPMPPLTPPIVTDDVAPPPPLEINPQTSPPEEKTKPADVGTDQVTQPQPEKSETIPTMDSHKTFSDEAPPSSPADTLSTDSSLPPVFNPPPKKAGRKLVTGALITALLAVSAAVGIFLVKQQQQLTGNAQAESCSATLSGIPSTSQPNTNFNVNVSLDSTTPDMLCQFVSLRVDGVSLKVNTTNNRCSNGSTYLIPISSGIAGTHTVEFAVNDSAAYPDVPEAQGRTKSICATRTFTTVAPPQVETKCNAIEITRNNSIISTSQIALGDSLNIKAYCSTTDTADDLDKIKIAITPPSGNQTDSDKTPTRATDKDTATQRVFAASENLTVSRSGTYTIKVWGHTPQKGWKGQ